MKITVLTPAYNRRYIIDKLYDSLVSQTSKNFEWMIVDDGSEDDLKEWIEQIKSYNKVELKYIYQKNGGKHRALNKGIANIESDLTFIVDSDDYLKPDAIETIENYYEKYKDDESLCGFSFLRCFPDGKINGPLFKKEEYKSDYITCRLNGNIWGDKAEVYYTKCLKEYPFLEVPGEKFLVESYVWAQLALKYDMIHVNKAIYVGNYLEDGLTSNMNKRKYESPIGYAEKSKILCNSKANLKIKCKSMILYIAYSTIAKRTFEYQFKNIKYKFLFLCMYPFGLIYKTKIEKNIKKGNLNGRKK